jgi:hypothetical protein
MLFSIGLHILYKPLAHIYSSPVHLYTDKKENEIFLVNKEIQKGAVAKSYMTNGLLIYIPQIFPHFFIYDFATAPI